MVNGAATFITLVEPGTKRPHVVTLELPAAWKTSMSGLPNSTTQPHDIAPPISTSWSTRRSWPAIPTVHDLRGLGKETLSRRSGRGRACGTALAPHATSSRSCETTEKFWGSLPYEKYVFFNMITEASGGLEHRNSTMLMTNRWSTSTRRTYVGWLTLAAHEYFHAWNVKRLRPLELGPFDYENEVYTTSLWVAEGLTLILRERDRASRRADLAAGSARSDFVRYPPAADDARAPATAGGNRLVRCVDQALSPRRELAQHGDQLLHQGRGAGLSARCEDSQRHGRRPQPGRCDASRLSALLRRTRLHRRRLSQDDPRCRREGFRRLVDEGARNDRRARLRRSAAAGSGCAFVRWMRPGPTPPLAERAAARRGSVRRRASTTDVSSSRRCGAGRRRTRRV